MFRQICSFQAVVRCGSFTEAAAQCFISQSAISQQVSALERTLGVQLLERENRSFSLTPAGAYFYQKSLLLTADYQKLCRETEKIARKERASLRLGCLRGCAGRAFRLALAAFSVQYPQVDVTVSLGNHEELYDLLRTEQADLVLNDQRRAFSDEYGNLPLVMLPVFMEIAAANPIAQADAAEISDLKNIPCILIVTPGQETNEETYYRDVLGFSGEFLFTGSLEEARVLAAGGKGLLPVADSCGPEPGGGLQRIPLTRNGKPLEIRCCAFWKLRNADSCTEAFAEILRQQI